MQDEPDGEGNGVGWPEGPPLGLVLGDPLGLALGELDGDRLGMALGDALLLAVARGLVVPGTGAALGPARLARLEAPVCGDGRALGVEARPVDAAGVGLA